MRPTRLIMAAALGLAFAPGARADAALRGSAARLSAARRLQRRGGRARPAAARVIAQAATEGEACAEAALTLALVAPTGRALWERPPKRRRRDPRALRVPGRSRNGTELQAWIARAEPSRPRIGPAGLGGGRGRTRSGFEPMPETGRARRL